MVAPVDTLTDVTTQELGDPTTLELPDGAQRRPFVVCGENPLAYRLIEELTTQYDGFVIAIVRPGINQWVALMRELNNVEIVTADLLDRTAFITARLRHAEALALVDQDDANNVEAALLAQEINPNVRIVIRMNKLSLGERISELLNNGVVLSASAIAAPAFVAAALDEAATPPMTVGDRTVVGILRERTRADDVLAGLAVMGPRGTIPEVLPPDADARADLVLAKAKPAPPPRPPRASNATLFMSLVFGRRMRAVIGVFLVLYAIGTGVFALAQRTSWADAAYSALITALTGNATGEFTGLAQIAVVMLAILSVGFVPALTATVVDGLVRVRLQREAGGLYDPISHHIVVVGLGDVGSRVARALHDQGVNVVAVERDSQARGIPVARELRIPVIIGDAARSETLDRASVKTCRALIIASTDDVTNLETALLGQAAQRDLRVVLRLFDGEFADRVRRAFNINISRSVSYLAAPAFAAAMIGRQVIATIPVRRRVLLLAEVPVGMNSLIEHKTVASLTRPHELRLLAVRTSDQVLWRPSDGRPLRSTDRLIVAGTRAGLSRLLAETAPDSATNQDTPFRLLEPWEMPHERPGSADSGPSLPEGPGHNPPFGPADAGSTRPA
jgi:Trk K+ transport system NAD-binding subunit